MCYGIPLVSLKTALPSFSFPPGNIDHSLLQQLLNGPTGGPGLSSQTAICQASMFVKSSISGKRDLKCQKWWQFLSN